VTVLKILKRHRRRRLTIFTTVTNSIKKIVLKTKQKPLLKRVKIKNSKNLPGAIEVLCRSNLKPLFFLT
jgi:hypothetical protein